MPIIERPLLFHGTTAFSVWKSYRHALAIRKMAKTDPKRLDRYLRDMNAEDIYHRFGPLYPAMHYNFRYFKGHGHTTALVTEALRAFQFSIDTKRFRDKYIGFPTEDGLGKYTSDVASLSMKIREELLYGDKFVTPGSILIIDHYYMSRNSLLSTSDSTEQNAFANALPWQAIRGIIFVNPKDWNITGFHARDGSIIRDLNKQIINENGMAELRPWYKALVAAIRSS